MQLEVSTSERETPIEAVPQAIARLQQHPIDVVFSTSGQVKTIRVSQNDPEWCRNIKRGIINLFQIAPKVEGQDPKQTLTTKTPLVISQKEVRKCIDCHSKIQRLFIDCPLFVLAYCYLPITNS